MWCFSSSHGARRENDRRKISHYDTFFDSLLPGNGGCPRVQSTKYKLYIEKYVLYVCAYYRFINYSNNCDIKMMMNHRRVTDLTNNFKRIYILLYSNISAGHPVRVMDWKNDGTPIRKQAGGQANGLL